MYIAFYVAFYFASYDSQMSLYISSRAVILAGRHTATEGKYGMRYKKCCHNFFYVLYTYRNYKRNNLKIHHLMNDCQQIAPSSYILVSISSGRWRNHLTSYSEIGTERHISNSTPQWAMINGNGCVIKNLLHTLRVYYTRVGEFSILCCRGRRRV